MTVLFPIFWLVSQLIWLFILIVFVRVVMSWLVGFQILNARNPVVDAIDRISGQLTEPLLGPVRHWLWRTLPQLRPLDLSPVIVLLLAYVVDMYLWMLYRALA